MDHHEYDIIIIGGGPTGLSAGIHLAQYNSKVAVLEKSNEVGGLLRKIKTMTIENYPGFPKGISGLGLLERIVAQAKKYGLILKSNEEVISLSTGNKKKVKTVRGEYATEAVILATGSGMQGLGVKHETWFGGGVFYCDECCKDFLYGKRIGIIGSSPEAIEEAVNLKRFSPKTVVAVDHAEPISFGDEDKMKLKESGVRVIEENFAKEIKGKYGQKVIILNNGDEILVDCIFIASPLKNIVQIVRKIGIETHQRGCIIVDQYGRTNIEGFFAAGACTSVLKDIIPSCVGEGARVATTAYMFLSKKMKEKELMRARNVGAK